MPFSLEVKPSGHPPHNLDTRLFHILLFLCSKPVKFKNAALGVLNSGVFTPQGHYTEHKKVAADSN